MLNIRRATATVGAAALLAAPMTVMSAAPASAADREFRYAGADVEFDVEKDDGRFEIEVEIDDAKPRSKWVVVLRHDGKRFFKRTLRANREGEIEIEKKRRNTRGKDVFKLRVKKVGGPKAVTRTIKRR